MYPVCTCALPNQRLKLTGDKREGVPPLLPIVKRYQWELIRASPSSRKSLASVLLSPYPC